MKKQNVEDQAPELELEDQLPDESQTDADDDPVAAAKEYLNRKDDAVDDEDDDDEDNEESDSEGEDSGEADNVDDAAASTNKGRGEADDADKDLAAMPEEVRERTRERFEKMSQGYQELNQQFETVSQKYEALDQDHKTLIGAITETGMNGEQFSGVLEYARLTNSTDPRDLQAARDLLSDQLREINVRLGDEDTILSQHPDLMNAVDNLDVTREHALELAKLRHNDQQQRQMQQRQAQQPPQHVQQPPEPAGELLPDGMVDQLNALGASWQKSDLGWERKWPMLQARLGAIYNKTRPEALIEAVTEEWQRIGEEVSKQESGRRVKRQRPLMNSGTGGAQGAVDIKDPVEGAKAWLNSRLG